MKPGMWEKLLGGGCRKYDRWLTDALAGELTPDQQAELDAHLAGCATCHAEFAARRHAWNRVAQTLAASPVPTPLANSARDRIAEAMATPMPVTPPPPTGKLNLKFVWLEIAASIVIVLPVLGVLLLPALSLDREKARKIAASNDKMYCRFEAPGIRNLGATQPQSEESAKDYYLQEDESGDRSGLEVAQAAPPPAAAAPSAPSPAKTYEPRKVEHQVKVEMRQRSSSRPAVRPRIVVAKTDSLNLPETKSKVDQKVVNAVLLSKFKALDGQGGGVGYGRGSGSPKPEAAAAPAEETMAEMDSIVAESEYMVDAPPATEAAMPSRLGVKPNSSALVMPAFFGMRSSSGRQAALRKDSEKSRRKEEQAEPELKITEEDAFSADDESDQATTEADKLRLRAADPDGGALRDNGSILGRKLSELTFDNIEFEEVSINAVVKFLNERSRELDPEKKGVKIVLDPSVEQARGSDLPGEDDIPRSSMVSISVSNVPLGELIVYVCKSMDLKCRIENDAVVIYARNPLATREEITILDDSINPSFFAIDSGMWRLLGGSPGEVRNYLIDREIRVPDRDDAIRYDAATGRLVVLHEVDDQDALNQAIETIRTTVEEQREFSNGLPFIKTEINPISTFSIDVDTASYALARRYLKQGQRPPPEQVRPEEFINAFDYAYRSPEKALFGVYLEAAPGPFRPQRTLFRIGVQGCRQGADVNRPSQFTLLIDASGSMGRSDRLGLAKRSVSLLLDQLRPEDRVAVLICGYRTQVLVPFITTARRQTLERLVEGIRPQGETNLERGVVAAYQYALDHFQADAGNRVIVFTDGIVGFGTHDADQILAQIEAARRQGVTNTVVGFGGDGDDQLLETLANRGDGSYVFLNDERDARQLFEQEFSARFHEIARDVKIQVEFNPELVAAYRQIGYQNRQLSKADFRNDQVDAGEVGAGQAVTALYELETGLAVAPQVDVARLARQPLATVRIRYRRADNLEIEEREFYLLPEKIRRRFDEAEPAFQLAVAVAEFAEGLRYPEVPGIASPTAVDGWVERLCGQEYRHQSQVQELLDLIGKVK